MKLTFGHKLLLSLLIIAALAAGAWFYNGDGFWGYLGFITMLVYFNYAVLGLSVIFIVLKLMKRIRMHNFFAVFCLTADLLLALFYFYVLLMDNELEVLPVVLGLSSLAAFIIMMSFLRKEKEAGMA